MRMHINWDRKDVPLWTNPYKNEPWMRTWPTVSDMHVDTEEFLIRQRTSDWIRASSIKRSETIQGIQWDTIGSILPKVYPRNDDWYKEAIKDIAADLLKTDNFEGRKDLWDGTFLAQKCKAEYEKTVEEVRQARLMKEATQSLDLGQGQKGVEAEAVEAEDVKAEVAEAE